MRKAIAGVSLILALGFTLDAAQAGAEEEKLALGRTVFLETSQPNCGICHTLAEAGTNGEVGPDLDSLRPDFDRVKRAVIQGIGPMPANEVLSEEEVEALAYYVSQVTGGAN